MAFSSAMFGPNTGTSMAQRSAASAAGKKISQMGRGGDTMAIHASPFTQNLLKALGGSGGVNPKTGLTEFQPNYNDLTYTSAQGGTVGLGLYADALAEYDGFEYDDEGYLKRVGTDQYLDVSGFEDGNFDLTGTTDGGYSAFFTTGFNPYAESEAEGGTDVDGGVVQGGELMEGSSTDGVGAVLLENGGIDNTAMTNQLEQANAPEWLDEYNYGVIDGKKYGRQAYDNMINTGNVFGSLPASENVQANDTQVNDGVGLQAGAAQGFTSEDILNASVGNGEQFLEYDINGDGKISSADAQAHLLQEAGKQTGGGFTDDEGNKVFLDENGDPYTGNIEVFGSSYSFENGVAQQKAKEVVNKVLENTDPNNFAGQIATLKAEIAKLSASPKDDAELEGINDFDGLIAKLTELFEKYMSSGYSPNALMNMFGFTSGNTSEDFNYMIPTYSGSDNVYSRKAVKDRDTGEVRYINVPIGDMASGGGSFRDNRRAGFGSMF